MLRHTAPKINRRFKVGLTRHAAKKFICQTRRAGVFCANGTEFTPNTTAE
jgi:hypothetical protein